MRTTYTGPVKGRGVNKRGQANVSREELESFREQYGKDKTLRDLLNAELPGAKPLKRVDAAPAGPRRNPEAEAKRKADATAMLERMKERAKPRMSASDIPGLVMRGMAEGAERVPAGRGLGAMFVGGAGAGPRTAGMASKAGEAVKGAMAPRAAAETAKRIEPLLNTSRAAGGKFRSSAPEIRQAAMAKRADAPATPMRSTNVSSDTGRRFTPKQEMEAAAASMRGAAGRKEIAATRAGRSRALAEAKAEKPILRTDKSRQSPRSRTEETTDVEFRKGGSVKGGGCETRGKKTRYV